MRRARVDCRRVIAVNFLVFKIQITSVGKIWHWLQRPSERRPRTTAAGVLGGGKEETGAVRGGGGCCLSHAGQWAFIDVR